VKKWSVGFSLIECLIYCAILALMSLLVFAYFSRQNNALRTFVASGQRSMDCFIACQLLAADIIQAEPKQMWWHQTNDEYIFKTSQESVAWRLHEHNVYRAKGEYDFARHAWEHKSTALVARHVAALSIQTQKNNAMVTAVTIRITHDSGSHTRTVPLMNRMLG